MTKFYTADASEGVLKRLGRLVLSWAVIGFLAFGGAVLYGAAWLHRKVQPRRFQLARIAAK